ncbi:DUF3050 domain-containing protein [Filimonas effusa]|uniref:DUF3050 domain-containing protein n=1 Tax=Filimonas effusa TaxID=2508721 RepID=A0A4Q1D7J0_9BACT|nr:DUF3050 domain-containing protein [Filimonas effusa]RXK83923.1 DUF3050 domain-containing protein [Filimonas effusa]
MTSVSKTYPDFLQQIQEPLAGIREQLINHPLYARLKTVDDIRVFTAQHVYAVWDFMSLLKSLQGHLTCVNVPWVPTGNANTRYLINEIVLGEETDIDESGVRMSHFELYLSAMEQMGADTAAVTGFLSAIKAGVPVDEALAQQKVLPGVQDFVNHTFEVITRRPVHVQAAVFTFGREDLIPGMFIGMVKELSEQYPGISIFRYYLERHIEVDGDHHSHLAMEMVSELCGDDAKKWQEAADASLKALAFRKLLWDTVLSELEKNKAG